MKTIERNASHEATPSLSAHEMATLLLLHHEPMDVAFATPDLVALQDAGLAHRVEPERDSARFAITDEGEILLLALRAG